MIVYDLIICFVTAVAVAAAEIGLNLHNSFVWDFYVIIKALNNKLKPLSPIEHESRRVEE